MYFHCHNIIKSKEGNFSKTLDETSFKEAANTNLESNSLVAEANNRRRVKESVVREKSLTSLVNFCFFNTKSHSVKFVYNIIIFITLYIHLLILWYFSTRHRIKLTFLICNDVIVMLMKIIPAFWTKLATQISSLQPWGDENQVICQGMSIKYSRTNFTTCTEIIILTKIYNTNILDHIFVLF